MAKKQQVYRKGNIVGVTYPELGKAVEVDVTKLSDEIQHLGLCHGIGQVLGDAASGKSAAEKFEMASRKRDALLSGDWELTSTRDDTPLVKEALLRLKPGLNVEKISEEKLKEYRAHAKVKAAIAQIRAERAEAQAEEADDFDL